MRIQFTLSHAKSGCSSIHDAVVGSNSPLPFRATLHLGAEPPEPVRKQTSGKFLPEAADLLSSASLWKGRETEKLRSMTYSLTLNIGECLRQFVEKRLCNIPPAYLSSELRVLDGRVAGTSPESFLGVGVSDARMTNVLQGVGGLLCESVQTRLEGDAASRAQRNNPMGFALLSGAGGLAALDEDDSGVPWRDEFEMVGGRQRRAVAGRV